MNFIEKVNYPYEMINIKYQGMGRFIPYLNLRNLMNEGQEYDFLDMHYEFDSALDVEMDLIKNGIANLKDYPKCERDFNDLNLKVQTSLVLCTRITNLYKILFVLEKYDRRNVLVNKFKYILDILQQEYYSLYGVYYNDKLSSNDHYKGIHGIDMTFTEYLIFRDLQKYFTTSKIDNYDYFMSNRKSLYVYMAFIYMRIEYEFIYVELNDEDNYNKQSMDFIDYYNIYMERFKQLKQLNFAISIFPIQIDSTNIVDDIKQHQVYIIKEDENTKLLK